MCFMKLNIDSPKPDRMKYHVENIVPLRREVNLKMSPHSHAHLLHLYVLPIRYPLQDLLQIRNLIHPDIHREPAPIQHIIERLRIMVLEQHRDASHVKPFHHSRASHFPSTGANAILAPPEHVVVRHIMRKVLVDLNIGIFVPPLLHEDLPNVTVDPSCVEN